MSFVNPQGLSAAENSTVMSKEQQTLRHQLAQKLLIDLRYYCEPAAKGYCQEGLTRLPKKLETMLSQTQVGGVIWFSENLQNTSQIVRLNQAMQRAILSTESTGELSPQPLYIAIDQEGGRVSRLPQNEYLGFAGNMAIGASAMPLTQSNKKDTAIKNASVEFASRVGAATAKQLDYLGFNVNFAPVLDVNSEPENPIINVRSYSQYPELVGLLGAAKIAALQNQDIAAAAKHFPGHGDTHIDSHVGLPVVEHSIDDIYRYDLAPFIYAINSQTSAPDMIMTAHIQYPALDNTEFVSKQGKKTILPATLSHKILTGLLREELGYKGLIVTDSLEMAAISQFLSPQQAVIKAFKAGADISLMPVTISSAKEADDFVKWLNELTLEVNKDKELVKQVDSSFKRIVAHKAKRKLRAKVKTFLATDYPQATYNYIEDKVLATKLSRASFTQIKEGKPLRQKSSQAVLAIMPDKLRCRAFMHYAQRAELGNIKCMSELSETIPKIANVDVFIYAEVSPELSFYESKQWEGITADQRLPISEQNQSLQLLINALPANTQKVLLKLRAPYVTEQELKTFDAIYASYDYQVAIIGKKERSSLTLGGISKLDQLVPKKVEAGDYILFSPAFDTFVDSLLGRHRPDGVLPVSQ
jgi:beta-N-acetylhexosaminidase